MSRRLQLCAAALVVAAPLAGCTADTDANPAPPPSSSLRLAAFDSCRQLEKDLRAAAKASIGPYGFPGDTAIPEAVAVNGARTMADAAPKQAFSTTNNHEVDADEPDIIKTDGRRIVSIDNGTLRVVDAASRQQTGRLDLGAPEGRLLLSGDAALVLLPGGSKATNSAGARILLVSLAANPTIVSRYEAARGSVVDARLTGSTARVVLRTTPHIQFRSDAVDLGDLVEDNQKAIGKADAGAWLPSWTVSSGTGTTSGHVECGQVTRPSSYSGGALLSILTFDLTRPELGTGDPVTVVADGDTVYATGSSLYVANDQRWRLDRTPGRAAVPVRQETDIYRFTTGGSARPVFAASGTVPGFLINQYALSEWDGRLRVATTAQDRSAVRVLTQQGDRLTPIGIVDGLGKGERIYSVRFIGDRGYVVTFRQTDPLYTLDLSNPAAPRVTGELKITGYSAHLQPAGDGRLIGIGQEADPAGQVRGTQVSLFDVSDPAAPRRLAQHEITGAQSEAEFDPHALLWWPATKLLVLPLYSYVSVDGGNPTASGVALRVTDQGVTQQGELTRPGVRRSLVIGDVLWTLTDGGLQASQLSTLDEIAWLPNG
ncbi:beta-propeller domain-containing protein [Actinoplanes sp. N902-109]|uniref:beta-propeller domain-containing protein n=1 Tax=Actinoplanes sp. (strain N902-109) TaxID=649831 RepID=UPI0003294769|nr:beta-propeller domain-containing protein [Actinoplanes sp. N902-109]AGL21654.1 beta propeller domain protein [Actinoplanes sp. N902-109]